MARTNPLHKIYRFFLHIIVNQKPEHINTEEWLEYVFGVDDRIIRRYIVQTEFKMPGGYLVTSNKPVYGYGNRNINIGQELWVRFDRDNPNRVDVEVTKTTRLKSKVFRLTAKNWRDIERNLAHDDSGRH